MWVVIWAVLAAGAGIGVVGFVARAGARRPPGAGDLPATPLQQLARQILVVSLVLCGLLVALVGYFGVERTEVDAPVRIGFEVVLVAILGVFAVMTVRIASWLRREDGTVDERDLRILGRSNGATSVAILFTLAIWQIALVERFHGAGAIPVSYQYVVFWSCVVVGLIAMPLGILVGYRRT